MQIHIVDRPLRTARFLDPKSPPHVVTLMLIAGIATLSMNIFLPSLPRMAEWFGTEYSVIQLTVSGYMAMTGVVQLMIGPLSDRFGRRPVMMACLAVFMAATLGCIFAPGIEVFLTCRCLQAGVASGLVLSRAVVRDMVEPDKAASLIGYITMGMAVMPMVGPTLGGALEQVAGWQSNFWALFVFGGLVLALTWADMGETNHARSSSLGAQFRSYPELFRSRRFWGYSLTTAFGAGTFYAFLGGAPWVADHVLGLEPIELGYWFACVPLGFMGGNFLSGTYSVRVGINRMIAYGATASTFGIVLAIVLFLAGGTHPSTLFGPAFFVGLGNGLLMSNATAGSLSVRPHLAGSAAGLAGALMVGGGAVLSALPGALLRPGWGPYPLLGVMLGASLLSILSTAYVMWIARSAPPLPEDAPRPL